SYWDGTCTPSAPASSASSMTVAPPSAPTSTCREIATAPTVLAFDGGKTIAKLCRAVPSPPAIGDGRGKCSTGEACSYPNVPAVMLGEAVAGDVSCTDGWTVRHLYFDRQYACTCSCGAAVGDLCSSTVTAYADTGCSKPLGSVTVTSDQASACLDVATGSPLG